MCAHARARVLCSIVCVVCARTRTFVYACVCVWCKVVCGLCARVRAYVVCFVYVCVWGLGGGLRARVFVWCCVQCVLLYTSLLFQ